MASWYGQFFQGKTTTSGVPFNMWAMTAAHRTLPLGTRVRVTNLENHLAVILRINDRGPVPESRIIDLSYGAARVLDFTGQGLTPVRIDILPPHGRLGVTAAPNPL
ncbi:MAG: septal ring lytic transglycosylase RlpA family protein [Terriglobales bacterium]